VLSRLREGSAQNRDCRCLVLMSAAAEKPEVQMGRASNRKKARRLAGHAARQASPVLRPAVGAQHWLEGSLGDRFFHTRDVAQAQGALTVGGLDLIAIARDSAQ
jgi:hypothetical protein